jgi:hypothetical protein
MRFNKIKIIKIIKIMFRVNFKPKPYNKIY